MMKSFAVAIVTGDKKLTSRFNNSLPKSLIALLFLVNIFSLNNLAYSDSSVTSSPTTLSKKTVGPSGYPLPRFVSFRSGEVNMRAGPGTRYPISWIYHRRRLPVEIIDEFDTWRQIRDWQGTIGWVHQSMLKGQRSMMVTGTVRTVFDDPETTSRPVVQAEAGVIGELDSCNLEGWCQVEIKDITGWLQRSSLYGTYKDEVFD